MAPLGPHVDAFERELAEYVSVGEALALSSGTAALHLAMLVLGIGPGDEVLCSSFTFAASANAIVYVGARPLFVDSCNTSWNIDPDLVEEELARRATSGPQVKAVLAVDLYGQCADYERLERSCQRYGVLLIEDAAEALGATCGLRRAGSFGTLGIFSFNGNKIITTSGGGMLVSDNAAAIRRARFLATQARDKAPHYQHSVIGYNYRMSNILAGVGRAQFRVLNDRVSRRRRNFEWYQELLAGLPGIEFMPEAPYGRSNRWLTCITINPGAFGRSREDIRLALEEENIESRPVWKPMHLQPVFADCRALGGAVSECIFETGLCLPSGSSLTRTQVMRVCDIVHQQYR